MAIPDFSTPEAAILTLEDAYVRRDIEAAVSAKDFDEEARRMLLNIRPEYAANPEMVSKASQALELSYRKHVATKGFPNFDGVRCSLGPAEIVSDGLVKIVETCIYPDGGESKQTLHVFKSAKGWRLIIIPGT